MRVKVFRKNGVQVTPLVGEAGYRTTVKTAVLSNVRFSPSGSVRGEVVELLNRPLRPVAGMVPVAFQDGKWYNTVTRKEVTDAQVVLVTESHVLVGG